MEKTKALLRALPIDFLQRLLSVESVQASVGPNGCRSILISANGASLSVQDDDHVFNWRGISVAETTVGKCDPVVMAESHQELEDYGKPLWASGTFPSPEFAEAYWALDEKKARLMKNVIRELLEERVRSALGKSASNRG